MIDTPRDVEDYWQTASEGMLHLHTATHVDELTPYYNALIHEANDRGIVRTWLEYGVGGGAGCEIATAAGFGVIGCDLSTRAKAPKGVPILHPSDLPKIADGSMGVIASTSTFQHMPDEAYARAVLAELARCAAPRCCGLIQVRYTDEPYTNGHLAYHQRAVRAHAWMRADIESALAQHGFDFDLPMVEKHRNYAWYRVRR